MLLTRAKAIPGNPSPPSSFLAPPRVCFLATSAGDGGIERHSALLAAHLREKGVSVRYFCRPDTFLEAECAARGVPTDPLHVRNSGDLGAARQLARLIGFHRADILHVHSRRDFLPATLAAASSVPRLVLHAHLDKPLGQPPGLSGLWIGRTAHAVIAVSEAVRQTLLRAHHMPERLVRVIPNGLELARFAAPHTACAGQWRREWRSRWNIPDDALVVGMVGRLPDKGQARLLSLAPRLLQAHPRLHLVLIGPEGQQGQRRELESEAARLGLKERVLFTGFLSEIPAALPALDVLVHLPQSEAFGLVLLEAMASGLPVVASRVGGCAEVVADGVTGILTSPEDQAAPLAALLFLLDDEAGAHRRTQMGSAGRLRAAAFSLSRESDSLQRLYRELSQPQERHGTTGKNRSVYLE